MLHMAAKKTSSHLKQTNRNHEKTMEKDKQRAKDFVSNKKKLSESPKKENISPTEPHPWVLHRPSYPLSAWLSEPPGAKKTSATGIYVTKNCTRLGVFFILVQAKSCKQLNPVLFLWCQKTSGFGFAKRPRKQKTILF